MEPISLYQTVSGVAGSLIGQVLPFAKRNQAIANRLTKFEAKSMLSEFLTIYLGALVVFLESRKDGTGNIKDHTYFQSFFESGKVIHLFKTIFYKTNHLDQDNLPKAFGQALEAFLNDPQNRNNAQEVVHYDLILKPGPDENLETAVRKFCQFFYEEINHFLNPGELMNRQISEAIYLWIRQILEEQQARIPSTLPKYLTNTPPDPPQNFTGRESDLQDLHASLADGQTLYLLSGIGGIGKTALALKYLQAHRDDYDHLAWVEVGNTLEEALAGQIRRDLPGLVIKEEWQEQDKLAQISNFLGNLPGKNLLVFDNANDAGNVRRYQKRLPAWSVLITSRADLSDKPNHKRLDVLPLDEATKYFRSIYSVPEADLDLLGRLLEAVGRHTLATEALAKTLLKVRTISLAQLYAKLEKEGLLSLGLGKFYTDYKDQKETDLKKLLTALYNLADLSQPLQEILRRWCLLPASWIPWPHLVALFPHEEDLETNLGLLVDGGWLDQSPGGSELAYKMHQLIRDVVFDHLQPQTGQPRVDELIEIAEEIMKIRPLGLPRDFLPYASEVANRVKGNSEDLAHLHLQIGATSREIGNFTLALSHFHQAAKAFELLGDRENLANSLGKLGEIYEAQGKLNEALKYYQDYNQLSEELYRSNPASESLKNGLAISYEKLGGIYEAQGKMNEALKYYQDYNQLSEDLYHSNPASESHKGGLANSYEKLGGICEAQGKLDEALKYYQDYNQLSEDLYHSNPVSESLKRGLAISYSRLGGICEAQGKLDEALKYYQDCNQLSEDLYHSNPVSESLKRGLAISYSRLGGIYRSQGKLDEALKYYQDRSRLSEELFRSNPASESIKKGLATAYSKLESIFQAQGKMEEAIKYFKDKRMLTEELYSSNPQSEGIQIMHAGNFLKLGSIYEAQGKMNEAMEYFLECKILIGELSAFNPLSERLKNNLAISNARMGGIFQAQGKMNEAKEYYLECKMLFEELFAFNPLSERLKKYLAISNARMGGIFQAQGKMNEAIEYFLECKMLFEELSAFNPLSERLKKHLAITYSRLGGIYRSQGKQDEALKYYQDRSRLSEELYRSNPASESLKNGLANSYSKLGGIYGAQGQMAEALKYYQNYIHLKDELYRSNPASESLKNGLAISYSKIGGIYEAQGQLDEALRYYQDYNHLREEFVPFQSSLGVL
ncbi:MAG: tetratricopeptide repeat protein [Bacteroidia bacterium]|nr:tetratricopeptide repeat protein [Bacteroidia bacterium]